MSAATPLARDEAATPSGVRVLLSNVAYGRGLTGSLVDQVLRAYRHLYTRPSVRAGVVEDVRRLVDATRPDVAGFIEVDRRLARGPSLDRLLSVLAPTHPHHDVANKYFEGPGSHRIPFLGRNCNAFCSTRPLEFERVYLPSGIKRLVHKITLAPRLTLFFAHLSLRRTVRLAQIADLRALLEATPGEHVLMGDFNVFSGLDEIAPLLADEHLVLLNDVERTTHRFHRTHRVLDLALASPGLVDRSTLEVHHQPYSDHDALLLHLDGVALPPPEHRS